MPRAHCKLLIFVVAILPLMGCASPAPPAPTTTVDAELPPYPAEERFIACLNERGWQAKRSLTSPPEFNAPADQASVFEDDLADCGESTGYTMSQRPGQWTEAQKRMLYRLEVENHNCIVAHGFPSDEPPTEQSFVDSVGGDEMWYQAIAAYLTGTSLIDLEEYEQLLRDCPPPLMFNTIDGF